MTMLASVTLLPAVIGFAGKNIDRWSCLGSTASKTTTRRLDVVPVEPGDPAATG